eukprot:CAMPEP_0170324748 /NCGR_PEP_ID=MMETSP0116_2-20130129/63224_1 /TAXON_ID=400756 /ORGANISM="Durinskia baltica, Strain CSIRO CS-38" /LENGTH=52 /DNA_ID=CAMNT_0010577751 /DNA_START=29 /DNA_END=183 /DNA_ORIENTATION=+
MGLAAVRGESNCPAADTEGGGMPAIDGIAMAGHEGCPPPGEKPPPNGEMSIR